jgi:hypothetical protein
MRSFVAIGTSFAPFGRVIGSLGESNIQQPTVELASGEQALVRRRRIQHPTKKSCDKQLTNYPTNESTNRHFLSASVHVRVACSQKRE